MNFYNNNKRKKILGIFFTCLGLVFFSFLKYLFIGKRKKRRKEKK